MSEYQILAIIAAFVFLYCLVAKKLERTRFSGALVYVMFGLILGPFGFHFIDFDIDGEAMKRIAEIALVIVLFSDSAGANLTVLQKIKRLPARLLLVGLPLTIGLGFVFAFLIYGDLSWIHLALLATILAPTDAALGKAVVSNKIVPSSVRESLSVESGLNDGICVPVLLLFLALAGGSAEESLVTTQLIILLLEEIGIGVLVGVPLAVVGSIAFKASAKRGWIAGSWMQMPVVAMALLCFATAQWLGGSGFIAAFAGGITFGMMIKEHKEEMLEAAEGTADVLAMITWILFGAIFIGDSLLNPAWQPLVYAVLSLTVIRMVPIFLSVSGLGIHWDTKLFLGWFGPRGLASIVFMVMVVQANIPETEKLIEAVTWTILLSVIAHGITANPLAKIYAKRVNARNGSI